MALKLSDGERIVKSWDYSKQRESNSKNIVKNVTVTTKRLVCSSQEAQFVTRTEISLGNIQSVSSGYSMTKGHKTLYLILALLMIALAVAAVFLSINYKMYFILVGSAAFTVLSVIFFVIMAKQKNTASFYLKVRTSGLSEEAVSIGDSTYKSGKIKKDVDITEVLQIDVDEAISKEIVDTIGALLLR